MKDELSPYDAGPCIHAALRKLCESKESSVAYKAIDIISEMDSTMYRCGKTPWMVFLYYVVDHVNEVGVEEVKRVGIRELYDIHPKKFLDPDDSGQRDHVFYSHWDLIVWSLDLLKDHEQIAMLEYL